MPGEFDGKVVMVTGANGGLGSAVVRQFYAAGASLALIERQASPLPDGADAANWLSIPADVTDKASVPAAVVQIVSHYGQIDVLAHTVGGYASGKAVHDVDLDIWDKMMRLNALSVYVTAGTVAAHMLERQVSGRIVVVLARHAFDGAKNHSAYAASKAAAQRIVESMALELREHDIRVNGIMPSIADTEANRKSMPNSDFSKWVTPEQIADAIAFLASDAAFAISGQAIGVYNKVQLRGADKPKFTNLSKNRKSLQHVCRLPYIPMY
jgi:NAD(P)-dependent dehydrogenase (short-subunit alcohol dehydrogenase family)